MKKPHDGTKCVQSGATFYFLMTNLLFSHQQLLHQKFLQTDLGEIFLAIPFDKLAAKIPLPAYTKSGLGRKPWFDVKGGLALQFLKHYLQLSDELLIQRINTDWSMQLFCGILIKPDEKIRDTNLPSWWRTYIGTHLNIQDMQKEFALHWKAFMQHTGVGMQDATCYESRISFPTDIKLIWNCCHDVYLLIQQQRRRHKLRRSRMNYRRQKDFFSVLSENQKKIKASGEEASQKAAEIFIEIK